MGGHNTPEGNMKPQSQHSSSTEPMTVTVREAVRLSGLSRSELYRRLAAGRIEARKSGSRTLIVTASLRMHLDSLPMARFGKNG